MVKLMKREIAWLQNTVKRERMLWKICYFCYFLWNLFYSIPHFSPTNLLFWNFHSFVIIFFSLFLIFLDYFYSYFNFLIYQSDFFYISLGNSMTHISNNYKAPTVFQQLFTNEEIAICLFFLLTSPIWFLAIFSVRMCQIFSGNFNIF